MNVIIGRNMSAEACEYERLKSLEREDDDLTNSNRLLSRSSIILSRKLVVLLLACNVMLFVASAYILLVATFGRQAPSELECSKVVSPYCESITSIADSS